MKYTIRKAVAGADTPVLEKNKSLEIKIEKVSRCDEVSEASFWELLRRGEKVSHKMGTSEQGNSVAEITNKLEKKFKRWHREWS